MKILATSVLVILLGGCCFGGAAPSPPLSLSPGFTPQPTLQTGTTHDLVVDASTRIGWECQGWIPTEPQHVVDVGAPMFLRVLVRSASETRLVVRRAPHPDEIRSASRAGGSSRRVARRFRSATRSRSCARTPRWSRVRT